MHRRLVAKSPVGPIDIRDPQFQFDIHAAQLLRECGMGFSLELALICRKSSARGFVKKLSSLDVQLELRVSHIDRATGDMGDEPAMQKYRRAVSMARRQIAGNPV